MASPLRVVGARTTLLRPPDVGGQNGAIRTGRIRPTKGWPSAPELAEPAGQRSAEVMTRSGGGRASRGVHRVDTEQVLGGGVRDDGLDPTATGPQLVDLGRELHTPLRRMAGPAPER